MRVFNFSILDCKIPALARLPWWGVSAAVGSGLLYYAAFPPLAWAWAAWLALLPLMLIALKLPPRASACLGLLAGLCGWLPSLVWLTHVSWIGWLIISAYCAIYIALFAALTSVWLHSPTVAPRYRHWLLPLVIPAIWTGLEFMRARLFTGFPWNTLATSQYAQPQLLAPAAWGGMYLAGFLVLLPAAALLPLLGMADRRRWRPSVVLIGLAMLIFVAANHCNHKQIELERPGMRQVRIGLVQLNIPQTIKWSDEWTEATYQRLQAVSLKMMRYCQPDLLVWPETVLPDFFRNSLAARDVLDILLPHQIPIIAGSMDFSVHDSEVYYYNSSFLLTTESSMDASYAKRHLVMFGEYVPLSRWLPFLTALTPITGSFTPGREATVFELDSGIKLAPLICFEDIIPGLARDSVRNGGRLLVNQTNDAWFDFSAASRQHMAHCVLRSIENRVPAVRSANTGVTCFIDVSGRIIDALPPAAVYPMPAQAICRAMMVPSAGMRPTFYTRHGDWFAWLCLLPVFVGWLRCITRKTIKPVCGPEV
ncbi:MAG: apolipoprotein N-acyltransferase [Kiritimatiellia bacterium]|nr:apolipoprotein N-acyltransferase [Lentisphaerota bacterium]